MRPIKKGVVFMYMGIFFLTTALIIENIIVELLFYAFGAKLIISGINAFRRTDDSDMSTKWFVIGVVVVTLFMVVVISYYYSTAGDYSAVIYYKKTDGVYILKGIEIYAKPERISGKYRVRLSFDADWYSAFGLIDFDPSVVTITYDVEEGYFLRVYPKVVMFLKQNTELRTYIDLRGSLVVRKPLDFDVELVPLGCGWSIPIGETKVVIS
jgi:hypothetical protein